MQSICSQNDNFTNKYNELNNALSVIGNYISSYGESKSIPNDNEQYVLHSLNLQAGVYVIVARVQSWVTEDTYQYMAIGDSFKQWRAHATGENNEVTTSIIQLSAPMIVELKVAHTDAAGARTFTAHLKAVRIA